MKDNTTYPYRSIHIGLGGCNKIAYYLTEKPEVGDALTVDLLVNVDGTRTDIGQQFLCTSCGQQFDSWESFLEGVEDNK